jgi:hypothetical protein
MGIFDFLFGGSDDSAQIAQLNTNAANTQLIRQLAERARSDVMEMFPQSQDIQRIGTQGALDVFGQTIPEQLQAFQGGNVAAQDTQRAALLQIQNALMGNPVDFNALQTFQPSLNTAFAQQNVPNFPDSQTAINNANNAPMQYQARPTQGMNIISTPMVYGGYDLGPDIEEALRMADEANYAPQVAVAPAPAPYLTPAPAPSFPPYVPPSVYLPQPRYTAPATNMLTPNKIIAAAPQYGGLGGGY